MAVATGGRFAERAASVKPIGRERPERRARRRVVRVASTRDARLVELYSGIGTTRLALEPLVTLKSAIAVDNSDAANAVYEANFRETPRRVNVKSRISVARISERDIERFVGELRWFDVEEIKRLHGVRRDFTFDACSTKKAIFLLGNSISVDVVREVLRHLIQDG